LAISNIPFWELKALRDFCDRYFMDMLV